MDKKIAGAIAAIGSIVSVAAAAQPAATPAEVDRVMSVGSFSELLQPIPNAAAILKLTDEQRTLSPEDSMLRAYHHHHHHHHHRSHHHHHHN
jgi:hypothetical protein